MIDSKQPIIEPYSNKYFMKAAFEQAVEAYDADEVPVGAVVVSNNKIIARAHNQTERLTDVTAHAEMLVLTSAFNFLGGKYLDKCTVYVTLEPCGMCAGALYWSQLGKLVFGASDPKRGYRKINPNMIHPKTEVLFGTMEAECADLLQQFFRKKRAQ